MIKKKPEKLQTSEKPKSNYLGEVHAQKSIRNERI